MFGKRPDIAAATVARWRRAWFLAWSALVLATACLQALGPVSAPLERTHGSAFSATTDDVALAHGRRSEAARLAADLQPLPAHPVTPVPVPAPAKFARTAAPRPNSTGPPLPRAFALRPAPRAPPAS